MAATASADRSAAGQFGGCLPDISARCNDLGMRRNRAMPLVLALRCVPGAPGDRLVARRRRLRRTERARSRPTDSSSTTPSSTSTSTTTTTLPDAVVRRDDEPARAPSPETSRRSRSWRPGAGQVFAQNMMYRHTVTVYDRNGELVKTIPDTVNLTDFGIPDHPTPGAGRAGRSRVHPRRHARVRLELLDVRRGLRPGGQRRLPREQQLRRELPLPHRHREARDRRSRPGREGAEVRGGHVPTGATCSRPTGAATT